MEGGAADVDTRPHRPVELFLLKRSTQPTNASVVEQLKSTRLVCNNVPIEGDRDIRSGIFANNDLNKRRERQFPTLLRKKVIGRIHLDLSRTIRGVTDRPPKIE